MIRKIILYALGIVFVVLAVFIARRTVAARQKPKSVTERVVKTVFAEPAQNGAVPVIIPANGNLVAKRRLELYAEVQGIFKPRTKLFRDGQKYRKGEVLIQLDANEYVASVQSTKTNFYNLITTVMPDLRLDYPEAYEKWRQYLANFDLTKETPQLPEFSSEQERYFITGKEIVSSYYNVKNLEERLFKYTITAPFSGILSEAAVTEGTLVRTGQKLGEFIDPSIYELEVSVSNEFADLLVEGNLVDLNNLEGSKQYVGKIQRVNRIVDLETQTVTAFIEVRGNDLREGMFMEAQLKAKIVSEAIEIDRVLLVDESKLYTVQDGALRLINVNPVYFSDTKAILKDVPEGTQIITKSVPGAHEGMAVKIYTN